MTPEIHATLIAARDWIAGSRKAFIEVARREPSGEMSDVDSALVARHYDPILARLERAIADAAWERADV